MKAFNEHGGQEPKNFKIGDYALHGDVVLERIDRLPVDFQEMKPSKDGALAYGEATGHLHQLQGNNFELRECQKTQIKFLRILAPTELKHQEHEKIKLPPGDYKIGIQTEYDPYEKLSRQVAD